MLNINTRGQADWLRKRHFLFSSVRHNKKHSIDVHNNHTVSPLEVIPVLLVHCSLPGTCIAKHPQAWVKDKQRRRKSYMFSSEVKFLPPVDSTQNSQCRRCTAPTIGGMCTDTVHIDSLLKTWPFSLPYCNFQNHFFPFCAFTSSQSLRLTDSWPQSQ